jgi:hypothetical protein
VIVALDTSVLLLFLAPSTAPPRLPGTNEPLPHARERVEHLIATLDTDKASVLVPTPVLSEVLVNASTAAPTYLDLLSRSSRFRVVDFDQRAAVELAVMVRQAIASGDHRGGSISPRQKIKIDRQILAIAKVNRAGVVYSDDEDMMRFGPRAGLKVIATAKLPLPPEIAQGSLNLGKPPP